MKVESILDWNEPDHETFTIASYHHKLSFETLFELFGPFVWRECSFEVINPKPDIIQNIPEVGLILSWNEPRYETFTIASYHHKLLFDTLFKPILNHWFGGNRVLKLNTKNRKLSNKDILIFRLVFGL